MRRHPDDRGAVCAALPSTQLVTVGWGSGAPATLRKVHLPDG